MRAIAKLALLTWALAACASAPVRTSEEPGAARAAADYRAYAWLPTPQRDESHGSPFAEAQLKQSVDRDLAAKGFERVSLGERPDFLIGWHVTTREWTPVEVINPYWGYAWGTIFGPPGAAGCPQAAGPAPTPEYERGTVILDVIDARDQRLVWRGVAPARLGAHPSGQGAQRKIDRAAARILARFPPVGAG